MTQRLAPSCLHNIRDVHLRLSFPPIVLTVSGFWQPISEGHYGDPSVIGGTNRDVHSKQAQGKFTPIQLTPNRPISEELSGFNVEGFRSNPSFVHSCCFQPQNPSLT